MRRTTPRVHGTPASYTNYNCRCERCRAAWREYRRNGRAGVAMAKVRATYLAAGLNQNGRPRKRPYDEASLDLMARFGLEPDRRFLP